ncbi:MAG: methionine adenosyltransferase domain-containing protein [bacterium]
MKWTAESVTPKHPDKLCDRISDSILDACLAQDPYSRVAMETCGGHGIVTVTGELTTNAYVDIREIVEKILGKPYGVQINVVKQSNEIAQGVNIGGAGDQGVMVGFATKETPELMPKEVMLARSLGKYIYDTYSSFDGKTQITWDSEDDSIETVVASFQNTTKADLEKYINEWLKDKKVKADLKIHANPAGDWNIGGFDADTGLTGRKIVVDQYGLRCPIGGGAFSGKDSTKVDRSGAYIARKQAISILNSNTDYKEVTFYLGYAIGIAEPVWAKAIVVLVDGSKKEIDYKDTLNEFTPNAIIETLKLREPKFAKTAEWGHFGNGFDWDK